MLHTHKEKNYDQEIFIGLKYIIGQLKKMLKTINYMKDIKEGIINEKIAHVHGLEDLILLR